MDGLPVQLLTPKQLQLIEIIAARGQARLDEVYTELASQAGGPISRSSVSQRLQQLIWKGYLTSHRGPSGKTVYVLKPWMICPPPAASTPPLELAAWELHTVGLGLGAALTLVAARRLRPEDEAAIRAAARPLLDLLRTRGLLVGSGPGDDTAS